MLASLHVLHTTDPALGRVDFASLDDDTRMRLFFEGVEAETDPGHRASSYEILGVEFDEEHNITEIDPQCRLIGTLKWAFVPPRLKKLQIYRMTRITGTFDPSALLEGLAELMLYRSGFSGEVDFTNLPKALKYCNLSQNKFAGSCILTSLPAHLERLDVSGNELSGSLDLTKLPKTLEHIDLGHNNFTGELNLLELPPVMEYFSARGNGISGTLDLSVVPKHLYEVHVEETKLSGLAVVSSAYEELLSINDTDILGFVDETGTKHRKAYIHFGDPDD